MQVLCAVYNTSYWHAKNVMSACLFVSAPVRWFADAVDGTAAPVTLPPGHVISGPVTDKPPYYLLRLALSFADFYLAIKAAQKTSRNAKHLKSMV